MNNIDNINVLALAYLGDSVYELYIRNYLIRSGIDKVKKLQQESINYVSAKSQTFYLDKLISNNFFTENELSIIKRGRNHKSHGNKNTDILTYKKATSLETLIGYLYLKNDIKRIEEIINSIVGE